MVLLEVHGDKSLLNEDQFRGLKKCHEKFDCLVYEMLLIKELRPRLNTQGDSTSAKLFVQLVAKFPFLFMTNCFSCIYRLFIVSFFFSLDNDIRNENKSSGWLSTFAKAAKGEKYNFRTHRIFSNACFIFSLHL